jgi:hypothetical protein
MTQKKGLSPLAWIALGCGGIVLIGLIVVVAGGLFVAKKATEFVEEAQKNPAYSYAKIIAAANPDIEVVDHDDERQRVSLKNLKTGEVVTLDLEEIQAGRISWVTSEGKVSIGADLGDIPDWVPIRPGIAAQLNFSSSNNAGVSGSVTFTSDDGVEDVLDWYRTRLENGDYLLQSTNTNLADGSLTGSVIGVNEESGRRITVNAASREDGTSAGSIIFGVK